jgi:hypothetical protein
MTENSDKSLKEVTGKYRSKQPKKARCSKFFVVIAYLTIWSYVCKSIPVDLG